MLPLFLAWCAWSVLNVVLMWLGPGLETVPFHLIWVSLAIVYGLQAWPLRWAVTACVVVAVATGIPLTSHAEDADLGGHIRGDGTHENQGGGDEAGLDECLVGHAAVVTGAALQGGHQLEVHGFSFWGWRVGVRSGG